jgi:hypothetical protein
MTDPRLTRARSRSCSTPVPVEPEHDQSTTLEDNISAAEKLISYQKEGATKGSAKKTKHKGRPLGSKNKKTIAKEQAAALALAGAVESGKTQYNFVYFSHV